MPYLRPKFGHMTLFWPIRGWMGLESHNWILIYMPRIQATSSLGVAAPASKLPLLPRLLDFTSESPGWPEWPFKAFLWLYWDGKLITFLTNWNYLGHVPRESTHGQANRWTSRFASAKWLGSPLNSHSNLGSYWYVLYDCCLLLNV